MRATLLGLKVDFILNVINNHSRGCHQNNAKGEEGGEENGATETLPEPDTNPEELLIEVEIVFALVDDNNCLWNGGMPFQRLVHDISCLSRL